MFENVQRASSNIWYDVFTIISLIGFGFWEYPKSYSLKIVSKHPFYFENHCKNKVSKKKNICILIIIESTRKIIHTFAKYLLLVLMAEGETTPTSIPQHRSVWAWEWRSFCHCWRWHHCCCHPCWQRERHK